MDQYSLKFGNGIVPMFTIMPRYARISFAVTLVYVFQIERFESCFSAIYSMHNGQSLRLIYLSVRWYKNKK